MAVLSLKIIDRNRNIQSMPQTDRNYKYPVLTSGSVHFIESQELIERWVDVIKSKAR